MNNIDAAVAGFFLVCVGIIVIGCVYDWVRILRGSKKAVLHESPYVTMPEGATVG